MCIWKLAPVLAVEMGASTMAQKAETATLSSVWIKVAEGNKPHQDVTGDLADNFHDAVSADADF